MDIEFMLTQIYLDMCHVISSGLRFLLDWIFLQLQLIETFV